MPQSRRGDGCVATGSGAPRVLGCGAIVPKPLVARYLGRIGPGRRKVLQRKKKGGGAHRQRAWEGPNALPECAGGAVLRSYACRLSAE